jgi:phosphoglycerate kinase
MTQTAGSMELWLRRLLGAAPDSPKMSLAQFLDGIPSLESLADVPVGTPVLVRGDVDAKPGATVGKGDIRLRSMKETLDYGRQKGWVQVIFGHIGRDPKGSLDKVRDRFAEILGCEVGFVADWMDPEQGAILDAAAAVIRAAKPGSVIVLENTRKVAIETVLWKLKPDGIPAVAPRLAKLADEFAAKIAKVYVNEAFSAGSLDTSTTVVPASMDRVVFGKYVADQFHNPVMECLDAQLVVSSGLKIDKLDDLEAMIHRGKIRWVFTAGSLAVGLKKAACELDGQAFSMGVAEDPAHSDKPYFIPRSRIEQAKRVVAEGRAKGIQFVMPVDFVLQDGRASRTIGPQDQQLDVGPETGARFEQKVGEFIASTQGAQRPAVAFHNGVLGMFEDARFEEGTRRFIAQLKRMTDAGIKVYVGGGEGGKALEKYGKLDWVTHNFTAGGTVLNALGSEPVPYLVAMWMANHRS